MEAVQQLPVTPNHRSATRRTFTVVVALLAVAGIAGAAFVALTRSSGSDPSELAVTAPIAVVRPGDQPVTFDTQPTNGVLAIAVPRGTAEVRQGGELGYILPAVINLHVGDKIVIANNDISPHLVMWAFIMPGQSVERVFDKPGSETYSAGCTVDPTPAGFSTIFISESA